MPPSNTAQRRLLKELAALRQNPVDGIHAEPISESNLFEWEAIIAGPLETDYEHGVFTCKIHIPNDYPLSPPTLRFTSPMFHPNIYPNGEVCISILHQPGDDPNMYESSNERWSPVQSLEKILLSITSMLAEPNPESGADLDACKIWRENPNLFTKKVRDTVLTSLNVPLNTNVQFSSGSSSSYSSHFNSEASSSSTRS